MALPSRVTTIQPGGMVACMIETGSQVREPRCADQESAGDTGRVAPDRFVERPATGCGDGLAIAAVPSVLGSRTGRPFRDHERATFGGKRRNGVRPDDVCACRLGQCGLRGGSQRRIDIEILVEPATPGPSSSPSDPARLLVSQSRLESIELGARRRRQRARRDGTLVGGGMLGLGRARSLAGSFAPGRRPAFRLERGGQFLAHRRELGLERRSLFGGRLRLPIFLDRSALDVGEATPRCLCLRLAGRRCPAESRQLLTLGLARRPQRLELGDRVRQLALGRPELGFEVQVTRRDRRGQRPPPCGQFGLCRRSLIDEAAPIALECGQLRRQSRVPELGRRRCRSRVVMGLASLAPDRRAGPKLLGQRRRSRLSGRQLGHRAIDRGLGAGSIRLGDRQATGRLVPAGMHGQEERRGQLLRGRLARRLLLGLGRQPASLRSELAEDVLDARQVRLGFDQLLLRPPPATLVAADAGHLLEQRPALLRPEGKRLVDHALADEQEGVVREVRGVEQVDQVAQPDPALVEEVVVLARAVQPPTELEHLEVDRQQPVGVVEDERDVGHALGGPLVRAGPDDVLGLARAERAALLPERPAERVREIALARSVGPDDGADPGPELHVRSLGERLEALQPEGEEARLGGSIGGPSGGLHRRRLVARLRVIERHGATLSRVAGSAGASPSAGNSPSTRRRRSIASTAAAVSAVRRDGPSPTPARAPSTQTSIRNDFSWSGPVAWTRRYDGPLAGPPLGVLLEPALGALERSDRRLGIDLRRGQRDEPVADRGQTRDRGTARRQRPRTSRPGATAGAVRSRCASPSPSRSDLAEIDPAGQPGQPGGRHDRGPAGAQVALVVVGVTGIQRLGDGQVDDGVTEELEAFVVAGHDVGVLVVPARVDECLLEQVEVPDREPDPRGEGLGWTHDARGPGRRASEGLGGVLVDVVDGVLHGADLLRVLVGDLRPELLFEAHDELDEIERVGVQVVDERRLRLDLILVGAELLDDDLLEALVGGCH